MAINPERDPVYIALEGAEGVGKSTQAAQLAATIGAVLTRETGGTSIGQRIRSILHDTSVTDLSDLAEAMLVSADRAQHIDEIVRPTIKAGRDVVSDRNWWSFMAYQGFGRQQDLDTMFSLTRMATREFFQPSLVIVLTASKATIKDRMRGRELDRFEAAGDDFHDRVDQGYEYLLDTYPDNSARVDTDSGLDATFLSILKICKTKLGI